jgi:hypothetical protein
VSLLLASAAACADDPPTESRQPTWQAYFRHLAAEYRMSVAAGARELSLVKEPVLKWTQPVRGGQDGAVFVWLDQGRPAVVGTFFIWPADNGRQGISHELHRLSAEAVSGDWRDAVQWRPAKDDVQWHPLSDAPAPQADKEKRAIQVRQLARRFSAVSTAKDGQTSELRLQPRAFYEYAATSPDSSWLGGALFSLAHGTDTEIILWIEARREGGMPAWHYALARMSDLELSPRLDDKEVPIGDFPGFNRYNGPYLCTSPEFLDAPPPVPASGGPK